MIMKIAFFCIFLLQPLVFAKYDVLGIGNPCIDYIQSVDDTVVQELAISKGGRKGYDSQSFSKVILQSLSNQPLNIFTGGSACNTMKGLANLGISTAITGNLGLDEHGDQILNIIENLGIKPLCTRKSPTTSQVASLVTEDGARAFCTSLDADEALEPSDLKQSFFDGVSIVHVEGYRLENKTYIETAMEMAKRAGALITFDLCNATYSAKFRERIYGLLNKYVDVLFLDEQEAYALTHLDPKPAAEFLKNYCNIIVVKSGEKGCWVSDHGTVTHYPALRSHIKDATGSGALFSSGFIYGLLKNAPLCECAYYGHLLGSEVIKHYGAEIPTEKWCSLHEKMK